MSCVIICKNVYFLFQAMPGELVNMTGHCQGKNLCLSSPQFVAGIHLAVPARAEKMDAR